MAKNHYVSQLVMKRFSKNSLNYYDLNSNELVKKQPHKVLFERDIYSDELEEKLSKLESRFATIIDNKILNKDEIVINREELFLIKKFLIVDTLKVLFHEGEFEKTLRIANGMVENYIYYLRAYKQLLNEYRKVELLYLENKKSIFELNLTEKEMFEKTLILIIDTDFIYYLHNPFITKEVYAWCQAVINSYIAFWDSADEEEFVLSDCSYSMEYDPVHLTFNGLDTEKIAYLMKASLRSKHPYFYLELILSQYLMYENYQLFNLSNNRCILCLNPFFKLYNSPNFEKPNIIPTFMHNIEAFKTPKNIYKNAFKLNIKINDMTDEDLFIYHPYKLTLEETVKINLDFIQGTKKIIGFNNMSKVKNTFATANAGLSIMEGTLYSNNNSQLSGLEKMINSLNNNKFNKIVTEIGKCYDFNDCNPFELFESIHSKYTLDLYLNYYIYDFWVKKIPMLSLEEMKPFEFLKIKDKNDLMNYFKKEGEKARKNNEDFFKDFYK